MEMQEVLLQKSDGDTPLDPRANAPAESIPSDWKQHPAETESFLKHFRGAENKHNAAINIQPLIANWYVHSYDDYRRASYFFATILMIDVIFVICVAVAKESHSRQSSEDKITADCLKNCTTANDK